MLDFACDLFELDAVFHVGVCLQLEVHVSGKDLTNILVYSAARKANTAR